jgi:FMN reductase
MVQPSILVLSSSPSSTSKTARVAEHILHQLEGPHATVRHIRLRDLPAEALLRADASDPQIAEAVAAVEQASGIVIATPIYKAAYSGLLKVFLDLLPQFALAGKIVLPCATGGSLAHVLALDYGLRPVLQSMGARHIVQSQFVLEPHLKIEGDSVSVDDVTGATLREAIYHFRSALGHAPPHDQLGHPRPEREDGTATG